MILSWLDLIFQFGLVADDIQLSSWQWPVYKKLYPVCLVTLPALCRLGVGVLLFCVCPDCRAQRNVSPGDTCPASSGATAEAPDHSDLE